MTQQLTTGGTGSDQLPVKVFVAATAAEWLPTRVLEYSILETASLPVEVRAIYTAERAIPTPAALENRPRTPFSFQRFVIPELCAYQGRAIYLDSDMQVFRDIAGLWNQPLAGCDLQTVRESGEGRRGQFSVMLLDCERLRWNVDEIVAALDAGRLTYDKLMYEMAVAPRIGRDISPDWNALEQYDADSTCLLHYTDMNTQPWVASTNPRAHLWVACLRRALDGGFISRDEFERELAAGHVRPSLRAQIDDGVDRPVDLASAALKGDRSFVAPYRRLRTGKARPWTSARSAASAFLRRCYYGSPLPRWLR